jgi:hypothetical protein
MDQLTKLKIMLGIDPDEVNPTRDALLTLMLEDCAIDILTWTNRAELPVALESTQRQIVIIRYNMQGVEGQTAHSEGSISRSFDELPKSIRNALNQYRLAKVVGFSAT